LSHVHLIADTQILRRHCESVVQLVGAALQCVGALERLFVEQQLRRQAYAASRHTVAVARLLLFSLPLAPETGVDDASALLRQHAV